MSFRKHIAGVAAAAVVASAFALAAPANAVTDADDPSFTPVSGDLIGVGSDTSQHALHLLAENGWNATIPAPGFKIASFAATSGGTITLPGGDITRPNGSGAGKTTLYNPSNPDVDFARSSSSLNANETNAGLQQFPFALDTLKMAVSNNVASNAPTTLTGAQVVAIYKCDTAADDWSELGGSAGTIAPKIPQAGSGTRSFFEAQLKALNGNVAVTLGGCVSEVQEHDDTLIKGDANAVAPFSEGRAGLLGTTLRLLDGWKADRALYNVVRGADLADLVQGPALQAVFGEDGFVCSNEARPLIAQAGFKQLARAANGGVCGQATTTATSNFTLNEQVTTTTVLTATEGAAQGDVHLSAAVSAATAPSGSVEFFEGDTSLGTAPLSQGAATLDVTGQIVGSHTYTAKFTGDTASQDPSQDDATVVVKIDTSVALSFSATPHYGKATTVTVTSTGIADGQTVSVKVGSMAAQNATVTSNVATVTVPATTAAKTYSVVATYAGTDTVAGSTATKSLVIAKAAPAISETFPTATLVGKPGKGVVKVLAGSTLKGTGTVKIFMGTKVVGQGTLSNGQVTITLMKLAKGKHTLTIKYLGSANVKAGSKSFTITQK